MTRKVERQARKKNDQVNLKIEEYISSVHSKIIIRLLVHKIMSYNSEYKVDKAIFINRNKNKTLHIVVDFPSHSCLKKIFLHNLVSSCRF